MIHLCLVLKSKVFLHYKFQLKTSPLNALTRSKNLYTILVQNGIQILQFKIQYLVNKFNSN